jgi:hypothetical protein
MIVNVTSAIIIAEISNFFNNNLNTLKNYVIIVFEVGVGVFFINFIDATCIIKIYLSKF